MIEASYYEITTLKLKIVDFGLELDAELEDAFAGSMIQLSVGNKHGFATIKDYYKKFNKLELQWNGGQLFMKKFTKCEVRLLTYPSKNIWYGLWEIMADKGMQIFSETVRIPLGYGSSKYECKKDLNDSQLMAFQAATCEENKVVLVRGPPGTGKTSVIAEVVKTLDEAYKNSKVPYNILICCTTNESADNIVEKLSAIPSPKLLRMDARGAYERNESKCSLRHISLVRRWNEDSILDENGMCKKLISGCKILVATLGSVSSDKLAGKYWSLAILEEAALASEVSVLPLLALYPGRLVLIGDEHQMTPYWPTGSSPCPSLFGRLINEGWPVLQLNVQYRMDPELGDIVSTVFYKNQLCNGTKKIGDGPAVSWIDCKHRESSDGSKKIWNIGQLEMTKKILFGLDGEQNAVVLTPYEEQQKMMEEMIKEQNLKNVKSSTIGCFQGKESDIVIFTTVRTSEMGILGQKERLNVAISRARRKLFIVGDEKFLSGKNSTDEWRRIVKLTNNLAREHQVKRQGVGDNYVEEKNLTQHIPKIEGKTPENQTTTAIFPEIQNTTIALTPSKIEVGVFPPVVDEQSNAQRNAQPLSTGKNQINENAATFSVTNPGGIMGNKSSLIVSAAEPIVSHNISVALHSQPEEVNLGCDSIIVSAVECDENKSEEILPGFIEPAALVTKPLPDNNRPNITKAKPSSHHTLERESHKYEPRVKKVRLCKEKHIVKNIIEQNQRTVASKKKRAPKRNIKLLPREVKLPTTEEMRSQLIAKEYPENLKLKRWVIKLAIPGPNMPVERGVVQDWITSLGQQGSILQGIKDFTFCEYEPSSSFHIWAEFHDEVWASRLIREKKWYMLVEFAPWYVKGWKTTEYFAGEEEGFQFVEVAPPVDPNLVTPVPIAEKFKALPRNIILGHEVFGKRMNEQVLQFLVQEGFLAETSNGDLLFDVETRFPDPTHPPNKISYFVVPLGQ